MKKYVYELSISASTENEAELKMKALRILAIKLSAKELDKLADILENDPATTALAKQSLGIK